MSDFAKIHQIARVVSDYYGMDVLSSKNNTHVKRIARAVVYILCKDLTMHSSTEIATALGMSDHSTPLKNIRDWKKRVAANPLLQGQYEFLHAKLQGTIYETAP